MRDGKISNTNVIHFIEKLKKLALVIKDLFCAILCRQKKILCFHIKRVITISISGPGMYPTSSPYNDFKRELSASILTEFEQFLNQTTFQNIKEKLKK